MYAVFNLCSEVNLNSSIKSIKLKIQCLRSYVGYKNVVELHNIVFIFVLY